MDALEPENTERLKQRNPDVITLFGGSQAGGYGERMLTDHPFVDPPPRIG